MNDFKGFINTPIKKHLSADGHLLREEYPLFSALLYFFPDYFL